MKTLFTILILLCSITLFSQNVGIGTSNPTAKFSVAENFKVDSTTGSVTITQPDGTIRFANPTTTSNQPMMTMFTNGVANHNRMLLGHSDNFPAFGLQYQDSADNFVFRAGPAEVFNIKLGNKKIKYQDGNQGNGKILVSDAVGLATWRENKFSSAWITSSSDVRDTTIDGTCLRVRTLLAPELTADVLNNATINVYMKIGSVGPYQLPYISDAGGATNQINCIFKVGYILVYRHTYNTCRFNSGIPESYPGQPVLVNLPQSLDYRYVITRY